MKSIRSDIQALRGWAVLVVLLYHVKIGSFGAGFLGVDIFFVISGYLITTLIAQAIEQGRFSLAGFYARRAKRLLPAAYVVILATVIAAPWFLDQQEMADLSMQVIGAITFTANIVFWRQTDYFAGPSDLKPLLHTWSLSVEEQYYMLLPALLLLLGRARWMRAVLLLLLVSLVLGLVGAFYKPVLTFYLLPTRGWELLIGSAGALWVRGRPSEGLCEPPVALRVLYIPSVLLLLLLPLVRLPGPHPGLAAVFACITTLVVILRNHHQGTAAWPVRALAWVGDRSYSLYLVHWPIIALLGNAWSGGTDDLPIALRLAALVLSFGLAYLLHRFVEDPLHRASVRFTGARLAQVTAVSMLLMFITPLTIRWAQTTVDYREVRRANFGFGQACEFKTAFISKADCRSSERPGIMVWGDSFAMHLVPGLHAQLPPEGLLQATTSGCGPFLGLAVRRLINRENGLQYDLDWARRCVEFNQSVREYLRQDHSIHTVVMSSLLMAYVDGAIWNHVSETGQGFTEKPANPDDALAALKRTVDELRAHGKKVVLVAPPPVAAFDVGGCLERRMTHRVILGAPDGCLIAKEELLRRRAAVIALIDGAEQAGIPVVRFDSELCDEQACKTLIDGTIIYRDSGHFTVAGSQLVADRMGLMQRIRNAAK